MSFDPVSYLMGKQAGGGGGGGVTVEPLSVSENGTYTAPTGKAYSPVNVNVGGGGWVRPSDWPDLDSISMNPDTDIDELYLTYNCSKTVGYGWVGLYAKTADSSAFTVERGHLSGTEFVADETHSVASAGYFRQALDPADGTIQLWRIVGYKISQYGFATNSGTPADNLQNFAQPCVEIGGRLGHITQISSVHGTGATEVCADTAFLERFGAAMNISAVTSVAYMFSRACSLVEANVSEWDTSAVTDMRSLFSGCVNLRYVDVSKWDVRAVKQMSYMFSETGLQEIDLSSWNTIALVSAFSMFALNYNLKKIDVSGWNAAAITDLSSFVNNCPNLETLYADGVDLSSMTSSTPNVLLRTLRNYKPFIISCNQNFNACNLLSIDSLLRIIDSLPTVETTKTLTLGQTNRNKLTAAQIAVATGKGWTVA